MQKLGKFWEKTKLIFYIFCPPPPLFKKRFRATGGLLCRSQRLAIFTVFLMKLTRF